MRPVHKLIPVSLRARGYLITEGIRNESHQADRARDRGYDGAVHRRQGEQDEELRVVLQNVLPADRVPTPEAIKNIFGV